MIFTPDQQEMTYFAFMYGISTGQLLDIYKVTSFVIRNKHRLNLDTVKLIGDLAKDELVKASSRDVPMWQDFIKKLK